MKTTPTCECGRWVRDRQNTAWYNEPRNLVMGGAVQCEECGEELPANPEAEESVPEPKTVTLHYYGTGETRTFRSITKIIRDAGAPGGLSCSDVEGECCYGEDGWGYEVACVTETPADITIAARKVFGEGWNCEGAVPLVVVLHSARNQRPIVLTSITEMGEGKPVKGTLLDGNEVTIWYLLDEDSATIREACGAVGVPCCEAETAEASKDSLCGALGFGRALARLGKAMNAVGEAIAQGFAGEMEQADAECNKLDPLVAAIAAKASVGLPKYRIETDSESQTLTLYEADGVTVAATLTMRDGGILEYKDREELVAAETTSEYPAAWEGTILPGSFVAYGCAVSVWKRDDGWSYSVNSPDHTHGANADSGLTQGQAIAGADMLARAWGKGQE